MQHLARESIQNFILLFCTLLVCCAFFPCQNVSAQQLYSYENTPGVVTFTSRKPHGKKYRVVSPTSPKYSVFVHRGLGYNWKSKAQASNYDDAIKVLSKEYQLDPALIKAVIHVESAFNPSAISSAGARGLMQLMPGTASRFGVKNSYDANQNMQGGIKYLRWLFERFDGNLRFVLAGYNAGEGAVDKYKGIPPYRETQDYVKKVIKMAELYRCDFSGKNNNCSNKHEKSAIRARLISPSNKIELASNKSLNTSLEDAPPSVVGDFVRDE